MAGDGSHLWAVRLLPFAAAANKVRLTLKCQVTILTAVTLLALVKLLALDASLAAPSRRRCAPCTLHSARLTCSGRQRRLNIQATQSHGSPQCQDPLLKSFSRKNCKDRSTHCRRCHYG